MFQKLALIFLLLVSQCSSFLITYHTIDNISKVNLTSISQVYNVEKGKQGQYFANQYGLGNHTAYFGFQPRPDPSKQLLIYSIFGAGARAEHENCKPGADGSPNGVSCKLYYPYESGTNITLGSEYIGTVDGRHKWQGYVDNGSTKKIIGIYSIVGENKLHANALNFWEEYGYNWSLPHDQRPCYANVTWNALYPQYTDKSGKVYKTTRFDYSDKLTIDEKCAVKHNTPDVKLTHQDGENGYIELRVGFLGP